MNVFENVIHNYIEQRKQLFKQKEHMDIGEFLSINNELAYEFQENVCNLLNIALDFKIMYIYHECLKSWFENHKEKWLPNNDDMFCIAQSFCENVYKEMF